MYKRKNGFAMILALIVISALLMVAASIVTYSVSSFKLTVHTQNVNKLKYIAEGGIESAIAELKNVKGNLLASPITPDGEDYGYLFNQNDASSQYDCKVDILPDASSNLNITSSIYNHSDTAHSQVLYSITATVDTVNSYKGNDYISDIGSKTLSAIDDIDTGESAIVLNNILNPRDSLSIIGSIALQGNNISSDTSSNLIVNNTDWDHSGDSKIKLKNTDSITVKIDPAKVKDVTGYPWFGDFSNVSDYPEITQISLKLKKLLEVKDPDAMLLPKPIDSNDPVNGTNYDMIEWKVPNSVAYNRATGVMDFKKIKNYIVNDTPYVFTPYISTAGQDYNDYLANDATADENIERLYKNIYKVILVEGDLKWNQPNYFFQSINWVVYCTGKVTFSSQYYKNTPPSDLEFVSDNVNCNFVARTYDFDNSTAYAALITAADDAKTAADAAVTYAADNPDDPTAEDNVTKTAADYLAAKQAVDQAKFFTTKISFCNVNDKQKNVVFNFMKDNLINYSDGLDVRIIQWKEKAGN